MYVKSTWDDEIRTFFGLYENVVCSFAALYIALLASAVVLFEQLSEVFVFAASRLKIEDLVFDTYP